MLAATESNDTAGADQNRETAPIFVYARLHPFWRKAHGKIQSISRKQFQGVCPMCGATGPKRKNRQEASLSLLSTESSYAEKLQRLSRGYGCKLSLKSSGDLAAKARGCS